MTNFQIITNEAVANGIYTEEEIVAMIKACRDIPLHTFAEWKRLGYKVRKGEHAKLTCYIWRYNTKSEEQEQNEEIDETKFYKTKAFFFTDKQVEKIATA